MIPPIERRWRRKHDRVKEKDRKKRQRDSKQRKKLNKINIGRAREKVREGTV